MNILPQVSPKWRASLSSLSCFVLLAAAISSCSPEVTPEDRPNIVLIITDDQGYGDLGFHGNPVLRTPHLDAMAEQSARIEPFYVSPVCSPTRASLLTGRYNYRTRVIDTYIGRSMMEPDEITLAEELNDAGYATGIFGKWHLGDLYPMRPMDQGFEETLVHRGGGIGQPADPLGAEGKYTDPTLLRNGVLTPMRGYCTDIYFSEASRWIEEVHQDRPFFAYIPTNAPHGPYHDVPDSLYRYYTSLNLSHDLFPETPGGHAFSDEMNADRVARIFAMITNIDENVGRLFAQLEELGELDNTLVLFVLDNGPNTRRFVNGMRGMKTSVYEGGVRSPFLAYWPAALEPGIASDRIAAHIDVMPTLLDAAGLVPSASVDGKSLLPLLKRESTAWPDRNLVIQSHRGNQPIRYHHFMLRSQNWKLVHHSGFGSVSFDGPPQFELYNMAEDPLEKTNVAAQFPDTLQRLIERYDQWFDDVGSTRQDNYAPPRIGIDPAMDNPSVLTRQDWRYAPESDQRGWGTHGHWLLDVQKAGTYTFAGHFPSQAEAGTARLSIRDAIYETDLSPGDSLVMFENIDITPGPITLEADLIYPDKTMGVYQMEIIGQ